MNSQYSDPKDGELAFMLFLGEVLKLVEGGFVGFQWFFSSSQQRQQSQLCSSFKSLSIMCGAATTVVGFGCYLNI